MLRIDFSPLLCYNTQKGGDNLQPGKPKFWILLSAIYLAFLCVFILIYNPTFTNIKNCFLLIPLYIPLFISSYIKHKYDECANDGIWQTKYSLIASTLIVVAFKFVAEYFR